MHTQYFSFIQIETSQLNKDLKTCSYQVQMLDIGKYIHHCNKKYVVVFKNWYFQQNELGMRGIGFEKWRRGGVIDGIFFLLYGSEDQCAVVEVV